MMLEENAAELQELAKKPDANNESEGVISRLQIRQMLYKNSKWKGNGEDEDGEKPDSNMVSQGRASSWMSIYLIACTSLGGRRGRRTRSLVATSI